MDFISRQIFGRMRMHGSLSKVVFIAESLECLEQLLKLNADDEVKSDFGGKMSYAKFREDYLSKVCAFYPTLHDWVLKNEFGRTLDEYERHEEYEKKRLRDKIRDIKI